MRISAPNDLEYGVNIRSLMQYLTNTELKQVSKITRLRHFAGQHEKYKYFLPKRYL
jgi:hypothetical protein